MTVEEIFANLSSHMRQGIGFHEQLINAFDFLNLCGYKACHEYHYHEEIINYRRLIHFFLMNYNRLIKPKEVNSIEVIPSSWYKYERKDVDTNTKRTFIRDAFKMWIDWETKTKKLLEESYKQLYEINEVGAALEIHYFIKDVMNEIKQAEKTYLNLESINYDINVIIEEQDKKYEHYKNKMLQLYN